MTNKHVNREIENSKAYKKVKTEAHAINLKKKRKQKT